MGTAVTAADPLLKDIRGARDTGCRGFHQVTASPEGTAERMVDFGREILAVACSVKPNRIAQVRAAIVKAVEAISRLSLTEGRTVLFGAD